MIFFKTKAQKIAEFIKKFPQNIESNRKMIKESNIPEKFVDSEKCLNALEKNYSHLIERYKFDDIKITQILVDAVQYNELLTDIILDTESVSDQGFLSHEYVVEVNKKSENNIIKIREIERRFKTLLGDEYIEYIENNTNVY